MQDTQDVVYISGGVTGITDYMERFAGAEKKLKAAGYKVFNPASVIAAVNLLREINGKPPLTYQECMKYCLDSLIWKCSAICMLPEWEESSGARVEKTVADSLRYKKVLIPHVAFKGGGNFAWQ